MAAPLASARGGAGGGAGGGVHYEVDAAKRRVAADVHGVPEKNVRGDLPALLVTPLSDDDFPELELPLTLAMTRSIGDFYMHTFGVTSKPEVRTIDLATFVPAPAAGSTAGVAPRRGGGASPLRDLTLILASDGIWDVFENEEVFRSIVEPPTHAGQSTRRARDFYDACIDKGTDLFESSADNLTGIVVYLNPAGTRALDEPVKRHAGAANKPAVAAKAPPATAVPRAKPPPPPGLDDEDCGC